MAIRYLPDEIIAKIAPAKRIEKLVTQKLTVNKAALNMLTDTGIVTKKQLTKVALGVVKSYKETYAGLREDGASVADATVDAIAGKKLLVARVQNTIVHTVAKHLKETYDGERYEWLPSSAVTPDPVHALNYGKTFRLGVGDSSGEDPGDRYGCQCGMKILVKETVSNLLGDD